jgi:hypothetical protein
MPTRGGLMMERGGLTMRGVHVVMAGGGMRRGVRVVVEKALRGGVCGRRRARAKEGRVMVSRSK